MERALQTDTGWIAGKIKWTQQVQNYTGLPTFSRTSPAVEGDYLVIGSMHNSFAKYVKLPNSTYVIAVNATNGKLIWKTLVSEHPMAGITTSMTIYKGGGKLALVFTCIMSICCVGLCFASR